MSMIDSFKLIPLWGTIGHIRGYINGLVRRVEGGAEWTDPLTDEKLLLGVTTDDLKYLGKLVDRLDHQLSEIQGIDEVDEEEDEEN